MKGDNVFFGMNMRVIIFYQNPPVNKKWLMKITLSHKINFYGRKVIFWQKASLILKF